MAGDKMKLELLLKGKDQLSALIKKQIPLLKQFDREANKSFNSLKKLFNLSPKSNFGNFGKQLASDIRKSNTEANKLKKTLESIGKIKTKSPKGDNTSSPNSAYTRNIKKEQDELDKLVNKRQKSKTYIDRLANINDRVLEPVTQIKNVWKDQIDSLKQYTDETSRLLRLQGRFKQINLSEADNKKVFAAVEQNVKNVRGISLADSQELFTGIFNALGDVDSSIAALAMASKYKVASKALYGDIYSPQEISEQLNKGFKYLELTGATKDRASMESRFDTITKIANSTGGEVTMAKLLALAKQASPAVQGLSEKGIRNATSVVDEMGGNRAGTALSALYRAWVGGIMKQPIAQRYQELGLIKPDAIEYNKSGILKSVKPGGNILGDLMGKDPLVAFDRLTEAVKADAAKKGIDVSTPELMNKQLRGLFPTETSFRLANAMINNRAQVEKESKRSENAEGGVESYNRLNKENSPLLKIEEYETALTNFKAKAGLPLLQTLGKIAETTTPILKFFGDNPEIAKWTMALIVGGKAITGIAQTASALSSGGNFLASFFRNSTSSAQNATNALSEFSSKADGLKSKKISVGVQIASVIGIDLLVRLIEWEINKALQAGEGKERIKKQSKDNYDTLTKAEKDGTTFKQKDFQGSASTAWATMLNSGLDSVLKTKEWDNKGFLLQMSEAATQTSLYPISKLAGANNPFTKGIGYDADKFSLGKGFKDYAPELKDSRIMVEFLRQLRERVPDANKQNLVKEGLQQQFPESFANAIKQLSILPQGISDMLNKQSGFTQEILGLQQPITNVATWFNSLQQPTNSTQTGFNNAANAANNFANRVNNLKIEQPKLAAITIPFGTNQGTNIFNPTGRAKGGSVQKNHTYRINEIGQEFFTPNQSGSIISNDVLRKQNGANSPAINFHYNPIISVNSDNPISNEILRDFQRELAIHKKEIAEILSPRNLAKRVLYDAERDTELM